MRFLSISLIYLRYLFFTFCPHKMFIRQPPYEGNSSTKDRSKPPARIGLLMKEEWNKLWEILEACWSTDPLDRPTASELEARLRKIFQPGPESESLALDKRLLEKCSTWTISRLVQNGQKLMEWRRIWHGKFRIIREISKILLMLFMFYCVMFLFYCILFLL